MLIHSRFDEFIYQPPRAASGARRVLLKPNLGYPYPPPVTVSMGVLRSVIEGVRRVAPAAEILIVEGVCHALPASEIVQRLGLERLLDDGVRFLDADSLEPKLYGSIWAPRLLEEVDCRISVAAYKKTILQERLLISASIKNLFGLLPRARYRARSPHSRGLLHRPDVHRRIAEVYRHVGVRFDGAVVDLRLKFESRDWRPDRGRAIELGQVVAGDNLIACDQLAGRIAGDPPPDYLRELSSEFEHGPERMEIVGP